MKKINKNIVRRTAENLILNNDCTTTLEVKLALRNRGYFALQNEVSAIMDELLEENIFEYWCNGVFRIYTFTDDIKLALKKMQSRLISKSF